MDEIPLVLRAAYRWFAEHGGDGAVAKTRAGGMQFIFQGEVAPFSSGTVKRLIDAGLAEYVGKVPSKRLRMLPMKRVL